MKSEALKSNTIKPVVSNRKARHEYSINSTYEAGLVLNGTEVKSLRLRQGSLQDAHCKFLNKDSLELYAYNFHITTYERGSWTNHDPKRPKKLLLNHNELRKLKNLTLEKGYVLIPLSIYFAGHLAKLEIGVCRGKRKYDKREAQKEYNVQRELNRNFKVR